MFCHFDWSYALEAMKHDDFLDEIVSERKKKNAHFPDLVEEAAARRALAQTLARLREKRALLQTYVAAQMKTE